jgi:hypothetical protein
MAAARHFYLHLSSVGGFLVIEVCQCLCIPHPILHCMWCFTIFDVGIAQDQSTSGREAAGRREGGKQEEKGA